MEARLDGPGIEMYRKEVEARLSGTTLTEHPPLQTSDAKMRKWAAKAHKRSEKTEQQFLEFLAGKLSPEELKQYQELAQMVRAKYEPDMRLRRELEALPAEQPSGDTSRFIKRFVEEHRGGMSVSFRAWAERTMTIAEKDEYNKQTLMILGTIDRKHRLLDGGRQTFV